MPYLTLREMCQGSILQQGKGPLKCSLQELHPLQKNHTALKSLAPVSFICHEIQITSVI